MINWKDLVVFSNLKVIYGNQFDKVSTEARLEWLKKKKQISWNYQKSD